MKGVGTGDAGAEGNVRYVSSVVDKCASDVGVESAVSEEGEEGEWWRKGCAFDLGLIACMRISSQDPVRALERTV